MAGVLGFGREPQRWLPDARVTAVRIAGTEVRAEFADKREIEGRLLTQLDGALTFLRHHLEVPARIEGTVRIERGLPETVLREVLLNALTHRDYRAASQVRVFVFDDRLEIVNPGGLLNMLDLDSLRIGGISQARNPAIAAFLRRALRREHLGIGIPEVFRDLAQRGMPAPEIRLDGGHFRMVLRWA